MFAHERFSKQQAGITMPRLRFHLWEGHLEGCGDEFTSFNIEFGDDYTLVACDGSFCPFHLVDGNGFTVAEGLYLEGYATQDEKCFCDEWEQWKKCQEERKQAAEAEAKAEAEAERASGGTQAAAYDEAKQAVPSLTKFGSEDELVAIIDAFRAGDYDALKRLGTE
jgi:hypothetical protein